MFLAFLILALITLWVFLYILVIRPKLVAFRYTAGIYAQINAAEATFWTKTALWLKGLKVMIAGIITSAVPLVPAIYDKISGVDWTQIFPSDRAKTIAFVVTALGVVGPMVMVIFHNFGLADAAATEPSK